MDSLAQLTDASLHGELKRLIGSSNTLTAQLLAHLGELDARGIHRERACSSLYTYCVYELRMSEDEAQRRCRAARLARQFPILLEMLAEASLHLTGILLLGPHLTEENHVELLARARFRSKREIERLVAEIAPCHDVPSRIVPLSRAGAADWVVAPLEEATPGLLAGPRNSWATYVRSLAGPVRSMEAGLAAGQAPPRASEDKAADATPWNAGHEVPNDLEYGARTPAINGWRDASTPPPAGESKPTASVPATELRYKVQFTADQAYVDLLEEARNLLQHQLPARDLVEVQRRALELLVRNIRRRKYAVSERPRRTAREPAPPSQPKPTRARDFTPKATHVPDSAPKSAPSGRYIPAAVRRSVWQRDEACCTYHDARGERCREQSGLEFHHRHPHARGGPATLENITLRCRSHNTLAAEQDFGRDMIRQKRRSARGKPIRASAAP
jgi:5-methylcytosine-specific restriction endonuclease McrA